MAPHQSHRRLKIVKRVLLPALLLPAPLPRRRADQNLLGDLRQLLIRRPFLIQCQLEKIDDILVAEALGHGAGGPVPGIFVVFDALGGADQGGVNHGRLAVLVEDFLSLGDEAFHRLALLAAHADPKGLADFLESLNVTLRLLEMAGEGLLQFPRGGTFCQLRQCLDLLVLGVVKIPQLVFQ